MGSRSSPNLVEVAIRRDPAFGRAVVRAEIALAKANLEADDREAAARHLRKANRALELTEQAEQALAQLSDAERVLYDVESAARARRRAERAAAFTETLRRQDAARRHDPAVTRTRRPTCSIVARPRERRPGRTTRRAVASATRSESPSGEPEPPARRRLTLRSLRHRGASR